MATIQHHRCSRSGMVCHQRCGGDRAEQAGVGPGLWGHPKAPILWRRSRSKHLHAAAPWPLAGGDPEEAGGRRGKAEGIKRWGGFCSVCVYVCVHHCETPNRSSLKTVTLILAICSWFRLYQTSDNAIFGQTDLSAQEGKKGGNGWKGGETGGNTNRGRVEGWKEGHESPKAIMQGEGERKRAKVRGSSAADTESLEQNALSVIDINNQMFYFYIWPWKHCF